MTPIFIGNLRKNICCKYEFLLKNILNQYKLSVSAFPDVKNLLNFELCVKSFEPKKIRIVFRGIDMRSIKWQQRS